MLFVFVCYITEQVNTNSETFITEDNAQYKPKILVI